MDTSHFPLIVIRLAGIPDQESVRPFFKAMNRKVLARARAEKIKIAPVVDALSARVPPTEVRKLLAELQDAQRQTYDSEILTAAVVFDSALLRGTITAINWLMRNRMRIAAKKNFEQGILFGLAELQRNHIPAPKAFDAATYTIPGLQKQTAAG